MIPPVYQSLQSDPTVRELLGIAPNFQKIFPWGEAPQNIDYPYVTYGVFNGSPENYLNCLPDVDKLGTQVDVWAQTGSTCEAVAIAVRNVLEPLGHMTRIGNMERDKDTKAFRLRMDFDLYTFR